MAKVGDKLGRYELVEQLGKGAAGTVFKARDTLLGIDVCVKVLHPGLATQPGIIERFKRELLLARRIAHPGICKIFDINETGGTNFLVMEYVSGETLSTILNRDGKMAVSEAIRVMRKVAEALAAAHSAGVVHRDIKPGNIIIAAHGKVTIVDFGVATAEDLDRLTRAGVVLGSRSYMAPETWQGKVSTPRSDVWALGVILYGCVTGRLPYKGEGVVGVFDAIKNSKPVPPSAFNADVTPDLERVIFKAMCVEEEGRYQDAGQVEQALAKLEFGVSPFTDPEGFVDGDATEVRAPGAPAKEPAAAAPDTDDKTVAGAPPPETLAKERLHKSERLHKPSGATPPPSSPFSPTLDADDDKTAVAEPPPEPPSGIPPRAHGQIEQTDDSFFGALKSDDPKAGGSPAATLPPVDDEASLYAGDADLVEADADVMTGAADSTQLTSALGNSGDAAVSDMFDAAFSGEGDAVEEPAAAEAAPGGTAVGPSPMMTQDVPEGELEDLHGMNMMLGQNVMVGDQVDKGPEPGELAMAGKEPSLPPLTEAPSAAGEWEAKDSSDALRPMSSAPIEMDYDSGGDTKLGMTPMDSVEPAPVSGMFEDPSSPFGPPPDQTAQGDAFGTEDELPLADAEAIEPLDGPAPMAPEGTQVSPMPLEERPVTGAEIPASPDSGLELAEERFLDRGDEPTHQVERTSRPSSPDLVLDDKPSKKPVLIAAGAALGVILLAVGGLVLMSGPDEEATVSDQDLLTGKAPTDLPTPPADKPAGADQPEDPPAEGGDEEAPAADGEEGSGWDFDGVEEEPSADKPAEGDDAKKAAATGGGDDVDDWEVESPKEPAEEPPAAEEPREVKPKPRSRSSGSGASKGRARYKSKRKALNGELARKGILPGDVPQLDRLRKKMARDARRKKYAQAADSAGEALEVARATAIDSAFVGKKLARLNKKYDSVSDPALKQKLKETLAYVASDFAKKNYAAANKRLNRAFSMLRGAR